MPALHRFRARDDIRATTLDVPAAPIWLPPVIVVEGRVYATATVTRTRARCYDPRTSERWT